MIGKLIIRVMNRMIVFTAFVILCSSCHMSSTGTMIFNFNNGKIVNFKPSPSLPGRFREVIIHASPKHGCFFTVQNIKDEGNKYTFIRKKNFAGQELASCKILCGVYPESRLFAIDPGCDRLFMTGCLPIDEDKKHHESFDWQEMRGFSSWCDLPENETNIEIAPRRLPDNFPSNFYMAPSIFHKQHAFLSKDILLCVLHKGSIFSNILPILNLTAGSFPVFLAKIDLKTNEYHIIKELKSDDGSVFTIPPDHKIGIKTNEDGKAAILVDHQLYVYDDINENLSNEIHIAELPCDDFPMEILDFSWISNEDICIWKYYDEHNQGNYIIYNVKTKEKRTGRTNAAIRNFFTPSICSSSEEVINLSTKEKIKYPSRLGSRIYEIFWLGDGLLGFTCDF